MDAGGRASRAGDSDEGGNGSGDSGTAGESYYGLDDPQFWTELECAYASAFGWSRERIYNTLDLPHYLRTVGWWAKHPPLFMLPEIIIEALKAFGGGDQQRPDIGTDDLGSGGSAMGLIPLFQKDERTRVQGAPADYYEQMVAELDAGRATVHRQKGLPPPAPLATAVPKRPRRK